MLRGGFCELPGFPVDSEDKVYVLRYLEDQGCGHNDTIGEGITCAEPEIDTGTN